jgi:hypothetical protein
MPVFSTVLPLRVNRFLLRHSGCLPAALSGLFLIALLVPSASFAGDVIIAPVVSKWELKRPKPSSAVQGTYSGTMSGFTLAYVADNDIIRACADYMNGANLEHKGEDNQGQSYKNSGERHWYLDMLVAMGKNFTISEKFSSSPYVGYGGRIFNDKGNHKNPYYSDLKIVQNSHYVAFGTDWYFVPAETWKVSLNKEVDVIFTGTAMYFPNGRYVTVDQKNGYGIKASLTAEKDFKTFKLFAEPYYRYWKIGKSEAKTYESETIQIGKSAAREIGFRLGLAF